MTTSVRQNPVQKIATIPSVPRRRHATIYAWRPISAPAVAKPQHCGSYRASTTRPSAGSDTNHVRCRGAKSFVDDLGHSRGVVLSRAVHFCDLLRLSPLTGRFVRFRRTRLRFSFLRFSRSARLRCGAAHRSILPSPQAVTVR